MSADDLKAEMSDRERADRLEVMCDRLAGQLVDRGVFRAKVAKAVANWDADLDDYGTNDVIRDLRAALSDEPAS